MASSDNFMTMDSWFLRPNFADSWLSESFSRENQTITNALQKSFSNDTNNHSGDAFNYFCHPETAQTHNSAVSGGSETETVVSKGRSNGVIGLNGGKITKRKPRKSKRSTTTYISADPANFRRMVQQVTGARIDGNFQLPFSPTINSAPLQDSNRMESVCLPTLDTSAYLLGPTNQKHAGPVSAPVAFTAPPLAAPLPEAVAVGGSDDGFDFESYCNFPILDSWECNITKF